MSFTVYSVMIRFTFSCHFSAESRSYEAPSQLTECRVTLRLFEIPQLSVWVFKINAHIQAYFVSLWCQGLSIHCKTVLSNIAKLFKQLIFHITMFCAINPHSFWIAASLQSLLFERTTNFKICWYSEEWDSTSLRYCMLTSCIFVPFSDHLSFSTTVLPAFLLFFSPILSALCGINNSKYNNVMDKQHFSCMKHALSSPWHSQQAAAHFMTHTCFTGGLMTDR
jgi:hypothetical protein